MNYKYRQTKIIADDLRRIDIAKGIIEALPILPQIEEQIRRKSLLKSSLFSARIEGNILNMEDITSRIRSDGRRQEKLEVFNILSALQWIRSPSSAKQITRKVILTIHRMVMKNLSADAGQFRREPSAIFNQAGVAVYMPPPSGDIDKLVAEFVKIASRKSSYVCINAANAHFMFEKIHPFLDGNGRVGRLVSTFILDKNGYGFRGLVSFEELMEKNRQEYYDLLLLKGPDITSFIEFFLRILAEQAETVITSIPRESSQSDEDTLLPRRREILLIIRDHGEVSFDFIRRRFMRVTASTLHYDLKQLTRAKLIRKLGSTRGVVYTAF